MEISEDTTVDFDFDFFDFQTDMTQSTKCGWGCYSVRQVANNELLPVDFQVYVNNNAVINRAAKGFQTRTLPTFNHYTGPNGGYLAIYTHSKEAGIYGVGGDIYVVGQVRVPGQYQGRIFVPEGYKLGDNCTRDPQLLEICHHYLPEMEGQVWVGGDTGGWFGIQR